ncbi:hypothetical protein JDBV09_00200 [Mycobacterium phage mika]|nr:hypothetical protein JDBV09_00200 [Mycobacterium phage mika]WRQ08992.1 hypothetical protein JDBV03_01910 [Mycobacterium phage ridax]
MNRPVFYVDQKEDPDKGTFWWTVVCWCPLDSPCHADVLLELADA